MTLKDFLTRDLSALLQNSSRVVLENLALLISSFGKAKFIQEVLSGNQIEELLLRLLSELHGECSDGLIEASETLLKMTETCGLFENDALKASALPKSLKNMLKSVKSEQLLSFLLRVLQYSHL